MPAAPQHGCLAAECVPGAASAGSHSVFQPNEGVAWWRCWVCLRLLRLWCGGRGCVRHLHLSALSVLLRCPCLPQSPFLFFLLRFHSPSLNGTPSTAFLGALPLHATLRVTPQESATSLLFHCPVQWLLCLVPSCCSFSICVFKKPAFHLRFLMNI